MALVALANGLFGGFVRIVATLARHGGVHGKPSNPLGGFEGSMAARTMPPPKHLRLRTKDVACVAIHRHAIEVDVRQRGLLFVALSAYASIRVRKALFRRVMTFVAFNAFVDDVLRVSGRKADLSPVLRDGTGGTGRALLLDRWNHVGGEPGEKEPAHESEHCKHSDGDCGSFHMPPT
jgi:hypothetical protein